jgi:translation initiation factor 2 subunit 3
MTAITPFKLPLREIIERQATMTIGTLGNVSEGKSTFVRALSGVATQKFKKEKQSNITIHLGYAGFKLWRNPETGDLTNTPTTTKSVPGSTLIAHYSFADCPGHEAYLATMLSGAAIMDAAALIVAANSPNIPQIQTQEHLMAAQLMDLPHVFTIQNKLDIVKEPAESLEKIRAFTKGTIAGSNPLIPMSAQLGWGVDYAVHHLAYNMPYPERTYDGPLRMMIVRSFDVNKPVQWVPGKSAVAGGVIGGTILSGVLHPDDVLEMRPGIWTGTELYPLLFKAKSLYCDADQLPYAIAGGLIGVGTTLDPRFTATNALIGQIVGTPGTLPPVTNRIKCKFKKFKRKVALADAPPEDHKVGETVSVCVGIMTVKGTIKKIDDKKREIILERPVCVEEGQICGLLRSNGRREILDGTLTIRSVRDFDMVRDWTPEQTAIAEAAKAATLARSYTVEEIEERKDADPLPPYEVMLGACMASQPEPAERKRHKLPLPSIERFPKATFWINTAEMCAALDAMSCSLPYILGAPLSLPDFFQSYVRDELSTTLNVKPEGGFLIKGKYSDNVLKSIMEKFLREYRTCKQCKGSHTNLYKSDGIVKLYCGGCTSQSMVLQLRVRSK